MTIKDQAAVVGVGSTPYYKRGESLPQTPMEMAGKAMLAALDDAGLTVDDLDGFALYSGGFDTSLIAQMLGVPEVRFTATLTGGGGGAAGSVGLAAAAIDAGMADVRRERDDAAAGRPAIRRVFARKEQDRRGGGWRRTPRRRRRRRATSSARRGWPGPARCSACSPAGTCTCTARSASTSPRSRSRRARTRSAGPTSLMQEPLTLDDYFDARMIADPLCLFDFCLECDGAVAVVTTSAERARDLRHPPAYVMAFGQRRHGRWGQAISVDGHARRVLRVVGPPPGREARVRDGRRRARTTSTSRLLYDHFTPMVLMQLEDYGFCGIGEGGPVRRRRQHPLAGRVDPGEHPRRQPVRGVHHRHDARERSGRAAARHGGQPGRGRRGRARHRRSRVDPRQRSHPEEVTDGTHADLSRDARLHGRSRRPTRGPSRSGRRASEHRLVAPRCTNCGEFRMPPAPFCYNCRHAGRRLGRAVGPGHGLHVRHHAHAR